MLLSSLLSLAFEVSIANLKSDGYDVSSTTSSLVIEWDHYHNYTEIVNILLYLNATYPEVVDMFPIGENLAKQNNLLR